MTFDVSTAKSAVTLAEAKAHLRVDHDAEDGLIEALCLACTQAAEHELLQPIITREGAEGLAADADGVPAGVKQWILLHVGHFFENRAAAQTSTLNVLPHLDGLLAPWKRYWDETA